MDRTDIEGLQQLLIQLATVARQLDRRSQVAVEHLDASTSAMEQGLRALTDGAERLVLGTTRAIGDGANRAVAQGVGTALATFNRQLQSSADIAQRAAHAMEEQRFRLGTARRALVWNALAVLLLGSLLAMAASGYVGWKAVQKVRSAQFSQDIRHATETGTLTRCGPDLCVKLGKQMQRYGKNPAYVLISE